ncbi:MAG: hypothetical protein NW220_00360 [Leptolyngbyaceae cyanobacterium bins.349]|nr:hypothetical protein [Leptolyngbyaceae cyanobacterium bins.349]
MSTLSMPQSADFHSLFGQLQARYPLSSLLTELVQINEGLFIVRALVQMQGTAIATAMAAAPSVEMAEDQARLRVLTLMGLSTPSIEPPFSPPLPVSTNGFAPPPPPLPAPTWLDHELAVADIPSQPGFAAPEAAPAPIPSFLPSEQLPETFGPDEPEPPPALDAFIPELPQSIAPLPEEPASALPTKPMAKPKKMPKEAAIASSIASPIPPAPELSAELSPDQLSPDQLSPEQLSPEEPDDLSSLIALTDIEMDRIGWTKQEGRDYLKRTYKKSTRQRLDVDELMDFLNYLRALPSLNGL